MSKWRTIPRRNLELDDDEINVLIGADNEGNSYITLNVVDVKDVLGVAGGKASHPFQGREQGCNV